MATTTLAALRAVGIHGRTGQATEEGTLAAGTLVREIEEHPGVTGPEYTFLASTDGGRLWYRQRSYDRPRTS